MNENQCAVSGCNDPVTHSERVDADNVRSKTLGPLGMTFSFEAKFCSRHSLKDYHAITLDPTL